jgi:hypothetical protein
MTSMTTEIVCRPAIAYFSQFDQVYVGLLSKQVSLRSLPSDLHGLCWGLSTNDQLRFERVAHRDESLLMGGVRLLQEGRYAEADDALRRAERMWTDNSIVHEALLLVALALNLGIETLQQRLFAAAKASVSLGLAKATIRAFGPAGIGDVKTAMNALKLVCGTQPSDDPIRSAVLALALDAHRFGEDTELLSRQLRDQFSLAVDRRVSSTDELIRLADAAYVAQTIGGQLADRYCNELGLQLDHRYTGLWSEQLPTVLWRPDAVFLPAEEVSARTRGLLSAFRR